MKEITANDLAREILRERDNQKIKERIISLRGDTNVSDDDFYQVFALVTLNVLGTSGQNERVNDADRHAPTHDDPLAIVEACLKQRECNYKRHEFGIETGFRGENCYIRVVVAKPKDILRIVFEVPAILKVPKNAESEIVKTICMINCRLAAGSFDYDYGDGDLSFRIPLILGTGELPSPHQVDICIVGCCLTVDRFFPEVAKICWQ